jgi:hypothetical protein
VAPAPRAGARRRRRDVRYRAVPFHNHGIDLLANVASDERRAALARLLSLAGSLDWWRTRQLGRLVWRAGVPGFDDVADEPSSLDPERVNESLDAFTDWALSDESKPSAVVETLFELPWQLVFEQPEWVQRLLESSAGERREQIVGGLHAAAFGGVFGVTRLTHIEATARKLADELQPGSPAQLLYSGLTEAAHRQLDRDREEDEELDSGWQ